MQKLRDRHINIDKAATMSIVINCVEVVLLVALLVADMFDLSEELLRIVRPFSTVALVVLIVEGLTSVRDGFVWKKTNQQNEMLREAFDQLDDLNTQMRKQRHDFLNHLQVVYSLIEMKEYKEANDYIERVYGSIASVGKVLRTANPAINALLQVKLGVCEKAGIQVKLDIRSAWKDLSIPGWEMCKVLGNLLDNAIDALQEVSDRRLTLTLTEDLKAFRFSVKNSGPMIPVKLQASIFQPGITTKAAGHGMGLFIVRRTVQEWGGDIRLISDAKDTEFSGFIPREVKPQDKTKKEKR